LHLLRFYRPLRPGCEGGYILDFDTIYEKIPRPSNWRHRSADARRSIPTLNRLARKNAARIKERFPKIHLHCYSASEIIAIAEYSSLSIRDTILRLRDAGLDSIPGGGAEFSTTKSATKSHASSASRVIGLMFTALPPDRHAHHRYHDVRRRREL